MAEMGGTGNCLEKGMTGGPSRCLNDGLSDLIRILIEERGSAIWR